MLTPTVVFCAVSVVCDGAAIILCMMALKAMRVAAEAEVRALEAESRLKHVLEVFDRDLGVITANDEQNARAVND